MATNMGAFDATWNTAASELCIQQGTDALFDDELAACDALFAELFPEPAAALFPEQPELSVNMDVVDLTR
eukprot:16451187-Heterocapsa_arctica.AAC.1